MSSPPIESYRNFISGLFSKARDIVPQEKTFIENTQAIRDGADAELELIEINKAINDLIIKRMIISS